jgi:Cd2+/Zn2+-exporting ATPase
MTGDERKPTVTRFAIDKMDCPTEEKVIRKAFAGVEEVVRLDFDLLERQLTVTHRFADSAPLLERLESVDMGPRLLDGGTRTEPSAGRVGGMPEEEPSKRMRHALLALSGVAALGAEGLAYAGGDERDWPVIGLALFSLALGGLPTLRKGLIAVRTLALNINFLMTVAIVGAAAIGQWPEAAMVTFLFALAEAIEGASLERARDAVRSLLQMTPDKAFVRRDGAWVEVDAKQIAIGDVVRVRPGERIAVDGAVVKGDSAVNQAAVTGESIPVSKGPGADVFAGTLNESGLLEVQVTKASDDTTLARIVRSIREAQSEQAPTQRFVDRFARIYTPVVVVVAMLVALGPPLLAEGDWRAWTYRALVLLVIACPCALVISTPVSVVSALAAAAKLGILVKGGVYLESSKSLRVLAVDKTGTLTEGHPAVTDVVPLDGGQASDILRIAAVLEAGSDHPIARAVVRRAREEGLEDGAEVEAFAAIVGRGVEGRVAGASYVLGSHQLAEDRGRCSSAAEAALATLERDGKSTMVLLDERRAIGVFGVSDPVRATSAAAVAELRELGIEVVMLTGDNEATGRAVAAQVGVVEVKANQMPDDKVTAIDDLVTRFGSVGMVGDGINDAPALAKATIGFAMGAAGTDTAIETADVALMQDDLRKVPELVRLSRRTGTVLMQNIVFAISIKVIFFALSLAGVATLWMAVFADMGASLVVVANGLRLLSVPGQR